MKHYALVLILTICLMVSSFSINSVAINNKNENFDTLSNSYLQCDYKTREITEYHASGGHSMNETWDLLDQQVFRNATIFK